ncbi:MAG: alpha/beta hydrolase [Bacteroidota bacterium]
MRVVLVSVFLSIFAIAMVSCSGENSSSHSTVSNHTINVSQVAEVQKDTPPMLAKIEEVYAIKNGDTLGLDVYQMESPSLNKIAKPVVMFVHGGGFFTGKRNETNIEDFCKFLAKEGYLVVNMDYRLTLKGRGFGCKIPAEDKIGAIANCVSDVRTATQWLLDSDFNIDKEKVFLAGSSAGAEAILHVPFWDALEMDLDESKLFNKFRYAGLMAFAGAMVDTSLINSDNQLPMLLFHGTCDPLVPYGSARHHFCDKELPGAIMLHGSASLADRLDELNESYILVSACGGKHVWAGRPLDEEHQPTVLEFLNGVKSSSSVSSPFQKRVIIEGALDNCEHGKEWGPCN